MSEKILVNVTPGETRVAVIDHNLVQEVYIERKNKLSIIGNIYKGKVVRVLPGIQASFIDIGLDRTAFLHQDDQLDRALTEGQEVLVQVMKDPISTKGARLTMQLSISSRYLVLSPYIDNISVSLKIVDSVERERLKQLLSLEQPLTYGFIIRTSAEGVTNLEADKNYLQNNWDKISSKFANAKASTLIYKDLPLALRAFRDIASSKTNLVKIDDAEQLKQAQEFVSEHVPDFVGSIELHTDRKPIFELYSVDEEISKALQRKVVLKSGGHLIIDQAEAMTTIDVNTGTFVGYGNLEQTVYKTNIEAVHAIARQIRLRNLGGIIIIDFIDMSDTEHNEKVLQTLEKELANDHVKITISEMSALGLVQITRKRMRESLQHFLCEPCSSCEAKGYVTSVETLCFDIFRDAIKLIKTSLGTHTILIIAAPVVIDRLVEGENSILSELEKISNKVIKLQAEPLYLQEHFDMVIV